MLDYGNSWKAAAYGHLFSHYIGGILRVLDAERLFLHKYMISRLAAIVCMMLTTFRDIYAASYLIL